MVKCTILKKHSLKACVALVVFSFSFLLSCINPVWAIDTTPVDSTDHSLAIYFSPPTYDPFTQGKKATLPINGDFFVSSFTSGGASYGVNAISSIFQPFDYDVTLVYGYALVEGDSSSISASLNHNNSQNATWSKNAYHDQPSEGRPSSGYISYSLSSASGGVVWDPISTHMLPFGIYDYVIPAGTNQFRISSTLYSVSSVSGEGHIDVVTCYLIHSSDRDVVNQVNLILDEVKKVNGNLTSSLSVLNQILVQCQGIKADTASIVSILGLCKDQLVTLNGKVDDIYKLLKDSLATETQALDQKSENVAGQIMQRVDSEQYWSDKNTENFTALDMGNWSFGDGVVGALPTVGNLFKSLWDSFGESTLIFVFPLMLGIALVIVGRLSRTAGKGSKKGGGDDG